MQLRFAPALACLSLAASYPAIAQPAPARDSSWVPRSAIYEVFVRDFSPAGDFRGVTSGLDRIQATGADVVWLMPIYPVGVLNRKPPLGSPYSVSDYRAINPAFGTAADFRALVQAVHSRGLKLILDWVPNHTSWDNVWVREHPDFYVRDARDGLTVPRDDKGKLTDWTDVAQLDYRNPALRREMIATMSWWLTEFGIDGFRVDAAGVGPDDFWREAVAARRHAAPRRTRPPPAPPAGRVRRPEGGLGGRGGRQLRCARARGPRRDAPGGRAVALHRQSRRDRLGPAADYPLRRRGGRARGVRRHGAPPGPAAALRRTGGGEPPEAPPLTPGSGGVEPAPCRRGPRVLSQNRRAGPRRLGVRRGGVPRRPDQRPPGRDRIRAGRCPRARECPAPRGDRHRHRLRRGWNAGRPVQSGAAGRHRHPPRLRRRRAGAVARSSPELGTSAGPPG